MERQTDGWTMPFQYPPSNFVGGGIKIRLIILLEGEGMNENRAVSRDETARIVYCPIVGSVQYC